MNAKERLLKFLDHLNLGQTAFEENVGISRSYISHNKGSIGSAIVTKIATKYPELNITWLQTGEGEMLKEDHSIPHAENTSSGIPHIESVEAFCGPGQGFDIAVMRKECPVYNIPSMEGADFTIRAKGRSMINRDYPDRSVKEGDYIGCVKCRSGVVRYGQVYALATSEGVMVKIVQESDREGYVLLESFNKEEGFKPFYYPILDIHDWALVVAVASINRWA